MQDRYDTASTEENTLLHHNVLSAAFLVMRQRYSVAFRGEGHIVYTIRIELALPY